MRDLAVTRTYSGILVLCHQNRLLRESIWEVLTFSLISALFAIIQDRIELKIILASETFVSIIGKLSYMSC